MLFYPSALFDSKSAKPVNLRLAAGEIQAIKAHREIFAEHVTTPLCPLGRVIRKLQLTVIWTPQTLTLNCVNKAGTAQGLMQCPIKGDTPYFTAVQFWMLRRALQLQRKGQKNFPLSFWKQLYLAAVAKGPDLRMAAKGVEKGPNAPPDMTKCSLPQLSSYVTRTLLGQGLLQAVQTTISSKHSEGPICRPMSSLVMGRSPPHSVINVGDDKQEWLTLLHLIATHRPAHLQHEYTTILTQVRDVMPVKSFPAMWETATMIMLG